MAKKIKKDSSTEKQNNVVSVVLKVMGKTYKATADSLEKALNELKPLNCKGKGVLAVEREGSVKERILSPVVTFRLFNSHGLTKEIAIKNMCNLF